MDGINHIDVIANAGFDGIIEGHTIYFTGLCPDCAQAKMP
jgi:Fur family peroxide stress response transcriptional regulator